MKKIIIGLFLSLLLFNSCATHGKRLKSIPLVNVGTSANTGTGDPLRTAFIKINEALTELNRIGIDNVNATSDELNILHGLDLNLVYIGDIAIMTSQVDADLTDNTPTASEITAALGKSASEAGKNYTRLIKDTTGSGLIYLVISDGTSWHYIKTTIAS
jgi:hypothetical protein